MNKNYPCFFICFNILCVHCKQFWGIMRKRGKNENQYLSCFHPPCRHVPLGYYLDRNSAEHSRCASLLPYFLETAYPLSSATSLFLKKTRVYTALLKWDPFKGPGAGPSRNCLSPSFCYRSDQSHMPEGIVTNYICFLQKLL